VSDAIDGRFGARVVCESATRSKLRKEKEPDGESGDDIMLVTVVEHKYEPRVSLEDGRYGQAL
jgi:hypothetical protein